MGNVLASSKPLSAAATQFLQPSDPKSTDDENARKTGVEALDNPGTMEELHKKCKGGQFHSVMPVVAKKGFFAAAPGHCYVIPCL